VPKTVVRPLRNANTANRERPVLAGAGIKLTDRDRQLLETLALKVRVLSEVQVATVFWGDTRAALMTARRRLGRLAEAGYVARHVVLAHPQLRLEAPLITWAPTAPPPDFGASAYRLRTRWTEPVRATAIVIATARTGVWLGGYGGRPPRRSEATHDLHLAAVYLRMLREQPKRARRWISEARLLADGAGRDEKLPDAIVRSRGGSTAIEFGGSYPPNKLAAFHAYCAERHLAYELW
jgi:hypothetical protein